MEYEILEYLRDYMLIACNASFLGNAIVKRGKINTKSQTYCFTRFMLMITGIIKIYETPNFQRNSHISCPISKVLVSIKN